ncbi:MAG TPA: MarC family protein [Bryobacteraceae bacterium]|jgi:multiple antibiotic resistance protein|nr:MarC family protein [Bryobacteraceae bacterium]
MPLSAIWEVLRSCLLVVSALFPIVNPLGNTPIFLSLTPGYSSRARFILSRQIAIYSFWLLVGSMLIGTHILAFFAVTVPCVQVGGGLVVMSTAWSLLKSEPQQTRSTASAKVSQQDLNARAFYPLTLPLTVGPGSISVAITLGANQAPSGAIIRFATALIGPVLIALTIFLCYVFAERIARVLGETAMNVIVRLNSFILLCIGVEITWNGVRALLH